MTDDLKNIHVVLKDKRIEKFDSIKTKLELNSDVDVMRTCLDIAFKSLIEENMSFKPELLSLIDKISKIPAIQKKYLVFSPSDIINDAINKWVQNHYSEYNLHSFSLRKELSEEEQLVALVFVEHQIDFERGMTLENIGKFLPDLDSSSIQKIIKHFCDNDLINSTTIRGVMYYHAPLI